MRPALAGILAGAAVCVQQHWLYPASGARNPTRFSLLLPWYNSKEQVEEVIADVDRRQPGTLVVDATYAHADDPVRQRLERDYELVAESLGLRVYRRRPESGAPAPSP